MQINLEQAPDPAKKFYENGAHRKGNAADTPSKRAHGCTATDPPHLRCGGRTEPNRTPDGPAALASAAPRGTSTVSFAASGSSRKQHPGRGSRVLAAPNLAAGPPAGHQPPRSAPGGLLELSPRRQRRPTASRWRCRPAAADGRVGSGGRRGPAPLFI